MSLEAGDDRAFIARSLRIGITVAVALGIVLALLWLLKAALTPLAVAWVIAYLLDPVVDRFEQRGVRRGLAILTLLLVAGVGLFALAFFVIPSMQREVGSLSARLPGYLDAALGALAPRLQDGLGIALPGSVRDGLDALRAGDFQIPLEALRTLLGRVIQTVTGTVGALISLLIIPVLAYYLLVEFDRLRAALLDLVPRDYQTTVSDYGARVDRLVSGFIRGQLTVCLVLGVLFAVGFSVIGIDLAIVIGVVSGLLAIIPYVGGAVAFVAATGMCLLQFGVDLHLAAVIGWYVLVQGLEGMVLTPRIVGSSLGMHPVAVLVALMIGGDLLGFLGLMVAVPLAAVVQVFAADLVVVYRRSELYTGTSGAP